MATGKTAKITVTEWSIITQLLAQAQIKGTDAKAFSDLVDKVQYRLEQGMQSKENKNGKKNDK